MLKNNNGFTLIEALMAVAILSVAIIGLVMTQTTFSSQSADRALQNALLDAASSALMQCQAVPTTTSPLSFTYENGLTVGVTLSNACNPVNNCNNVTATATANSKSMSLTTRVCGFN